MSSPPATATRPHGSSLPEEIFVWEILVRLPHKDLIRCRAVSHAWRRAASARDVLLEHHRRQRPLPLINRIGSPGETRWNTIAALDHRAAQRLQPVARLDGFHVVVKASCDGLLLLEEGLRGTPLGMRASICNPATRQIGRLPQLKGYVVLALYRHRPTGEYRLLLRWVYNRRSMYIFALDRHQLPPSRVHCPLDASCYQSSFSTPVLLRDHLHWTWHTPTLPRQTESKTVLVFDTAAESFRQMCSPVVPVYRADLFEMDGVLGMYSWDNGMRAVRIWVMQDYESHVWSLKCCVKLPVPEMPQVHERRAGRNLMAVYEEGCVRVLVACGELLLYVDTEGKLLASSRDDDGHSFSISKQFLKQSLVSHAFFSTLQGDTNAWPFI
ncbi:unnamed protein product [Alopecurus aequalis]